MSLESEFIPPTPLVDPFQRVVRYLRVSVTDRCNLRHGIADLVAMING